MKYFLKRIAGAAGVRGRALLAAMIMVAPLLGLAVADSAFAQGHRRPPPPHNAWRPMYYRHYHRPYVRVPPPVVVAPPPVVYAPPPSPGISLFLPIEIH
ncbi:MAG TPA: hypothetical protein VMT94_07185 [Burkholderiales bacterium]|nr:hypothetical protein [Burkholderiales bacterium]